MVEKESEEARKKKEEEGKGESGERKQTSTPQIRKRSKTTYLALVGMIAGLYAVTTLGLGNLSYGPVNLRLSNILIGIVPIVGWPSVFGIALGVLLGNIGSSLGLIDLVSALFSLCGLAVIQLLRKKSVLLGLLIYSVIVSLWVNYELALVIHLPYFPTFYATFAGITFVATVLGYITYRALAVSGLRKRIESVV